MSKKWIMADLHLGEERLNLMRRPFATVDQMHDTLIRNHNALVEPHDLVYVVGDVCNKDHLDLLPLINQFNGWKILIRGNHDRGLTEEQCKRYFVETIPEGDGINIEVGDIPCHITHYPTLGVRDRFNLVGHIHSAWKLQLNMLNVGVDVNHYRPLDVDVDVPFFFNAVRDIYDEDVWVAYEKCNMSHLNLRGKKGRYFVDNAYGNV